MMGPELLFEVVEEDKFGFDSIRLYVLILKQDTNSHSLELRFYTFDKIFNPI